MAYPLIRTINLIKTFSRKNPSGENQEKEKEYWKKEQQQQGIIKKENQKN